MGYGCIGMGMMGKNQGFTLVELLVAVAIISLLAAIAIPQYKRFMRRSRRAEAILLLKAVHKNQMSFFSTHDQFYPPNAPRNGFDTEWASVVNAFFDLGPTTTNLGWSYSLYMTWGPVGGNEDRSIGYNISVFQNTDDDPFDPPDVFIVQTNSRVSGSVGCPDGVPYQIYDDILNTTKTC